MCELVNSSQSHKTKQSKLKIQLKSIIQNYDNFKDTMHVQDGPHRISYSAFSSPASFDDLHYSPQ